MTETNPGSSLSAGNVYMRLFLLFLRKVKGELLLSHVRVETTVYAFTLVSISNHSTRRNLLLYDFV